jgi:hypothetical protein
MAPEQPLLRRRLQILDDETRDTQRFDVRADGDIWVHAVIAVKNFMVRLVALVRKTGGNN